jgi:hypothetical protein
MYWPIATKSAKPNVATTEPGHFRSLENIQKSAQVAVAMRCDKEQSGKDAQKAHNLPRNGLSANQNALRRSGWCRPIFGGGTQAILSGKQIAMAARFAVYGHLPA